MIIKSMKAVFGKLKGETITFNEGLNIIYAPNESGKSTWCAFIRAMLYGIDTSERAKAGYIPDKLRYAPWSGALMEGTMDINAGGKDITLVRSSPNAANPMKDFNALYTGTALQVDGLDGNNAGLVLTGVTKEVFRRSAFVEQGTVAVSGSPELEKRINSLFTSGDEQTSCTEADRRLREWKNRRRSSRGGILPAIEGEIDGKNRLLARASELAGQREQLEEQRLEEAEECDALEKQVTEERKLQRRQALSALGESRFQLEAAKTDLEKAEEELRNAKEALKAGFFGPVSPDKIRARTDEDIEEYEKLQALKDGKTAVSPIPFLSALVLGMMLGIFCYIKYSLIGLIGAGVIFAAGMVLLAFYLSAKHVILKADARQKEILSAYGTVFLSDVKGLADTHERLCREVLAAADAEKTAQRDYAERLEESEKLQRSVLSDLDFSSEGTGEAARLSRLLKEKKELLSETEKKLAAISGAQSEGGDPLVTASAVLTLEDRYDAVSADYDAICLASEVLREADAEIQQRFAPKLGKLAAEYMSVLTGGRYTEVMINRDFSALARTGDDTVARDAGYLSAGTLDLLYLAVRLAVCSIALPEGENCPLIIDDALVNMDGERKERAAKLLKELSQTRQVILFTCTKP